MYNKLCILNTKTLQFLVYKKSFFFEKLTSQINFEARLNCTVFVGVEKQKQIDVTFLCAPGGRAIFILFDRFYLLYI